MDEIPETNARASQPPGAQTKIAELIEHISDGFVAFDREMNYVYVNKRAGELLGRKPEDLIGRNYWGEYPEARGTPFANAYLQALQTQVPVLIEDYYAPWDRWFENRIYPSGDGISILFTEITERKKTLENIQEQNRLFTALVETIPGLVYIYDWQTDSNMYSNKGIEYLLGYTPEEVKEMGRKLFNRLANSDDLESILSSQSRLKSARDEDTVEVEYRMRHANGDWRWLRSYERPFARNSDGSLKQKFGIALDVTAHKRAEEQIQQQLKHLNALRMIDIAINSSFDLRVILNIVLQYIASYLSVDASAVLIFQHQLQSMEYVASRGFQSPLVQRSPLRNTAGYASRVAAERRTIHLNDAPDTGTETTRSPQMVKEGFVDYYGTPLIVKGEVKGVLEIYHRAPLELNSEQLQFFETLAGQAAIAVDNALLFNSMQQANTDLIIAYDATIAGWSRAMALHDQESDGYAQRVTDLTMALAEAMRIPELQLVHIRRGALLHDIGKILIPDHVLLKTEPLTEEETRLLEKHPEYAYELLSPIGYLQPALDIPYCHHEKWDGTGYPRRLRGEEIPIAARIFTVADVWDHVSSDHRDRKVMSRPDALEYIRSESGKSFDPRVVDAFLRLLSESDQ